MTEQSPNTPITVSLPDLISKALVKFKGKETVVDEFGNERFYSSDHAADDVLDELLVDHRLDIKDVLFEIIGQTTKEARDLEGTSFDGFDNYENLFRILASTIIYYEMRDQDASIIAEDERRDEADLVKYQKAQDKKSVFEL